MFALRAQLADGRDREMQAVSAPTGQEPSNFPRAIRSAIKVVTVPALWATLVDPRRSWIGGHLAPADPDTRIPVGCQRLGSLPACR